MKTLTLLVSMFLSSLSYGSQLSGQITVPTGSDGSSLSDFDFVGSSYAFVVTTGVVSVNPSILYGIILASAATTDGYTIFDATCTAGPSCATADHQITGRLTSESATLPTYRYFTPPIRTNRGITVFAPVGNPDTKATILYDLR